MFCSAVCFLATPALGFCLQPHRSVACDFLNSDAVFIGTVISTQNTPAQGDEFDEGWTYEMSVQKMYRGPSGKTIKIFTENKSGRYPLELRKEYLIFASINRGRLEIFNCDDSAPLSATEDIINQIEKLTIPEDGIVEGQVALRQIPSDQGLAGVQIFIRGGEKTYTAITDDRGWFRIHVPPGAYSAEARSMPAHPITNYDLSYDGPDRFAVKAGRCADLQFVADSRYKY
jgi:hypothetical protein